eukprot:20943-Heterococcus_DN1.PRE.2
MGRARTFVAANLGAQLQVAPPDIHANLLLNQNLQGPLLMQQCNDLCSEETQQDVSSVCRWFSTHLQGALCSCEEREFHIQAMKLLT